jgi:hypothetical protein
MRAIRRNLEHQALDADRRQRKCSDVSEAMRAGELDRDAIRAVRGRRRERDDHHALGKLRRQRVSLG